MARHLEGRCTTLIFDDFHSASFDINNGLDQGDPHSLICYLIYNADLLAIPNTRNGEMGLLFVDDAAIVAVGEDFTETHQKLRTVMTKPDGIFDWARLHNCEFGIDKFQLLDASRRTAQHPFMPRRRIPLPRKTLVINGHRIEPKTSVKFLGIHVDQTLRWKEQCASALAKGQDWLIQFGRLAKTSRGVATQHVRRLYVAIALPRMLYAADIFLTPHRRSQNPNARKSGRAVINKLGAIQRKATVMITGAMRTTATDVLDVHTDLLPFHLLVDKHRQRAALRLATLPESHPLHKPVKNAAARNVKKHPTPLHELMHTYKIKPQLTETIRSVRQDTKWAPNLATRTAGTAEQAEKEDGDDQADIQVYSDGSGIEGKIGAAAVLYRDGVLQGELRFHLGSDKHHTVYEGEGIGMVLGLELIRSERHVNRLTSMGVDNQAAISATGLI